MTTRRPVLRLRPGRAARRPDTLAVEEPLLVRVGDRVLTSTMRTPGHDFDLVAGWLVGEGAVREKPEIAGLKECINEDNTIEVTLAVGVAPPRQRAFETTSACGVCGADRIVDVASAMRWKLRDDPTRVDVAVLSALPDAMRAEQRVFDRTGGLHAAGLFTTSGGVVIVREDVGRHNAVDKVVGAALLAGRLPLAGHVLQVSGRASFELVQKAAAAGVPVLAAVSAPSSLAVDLADECDLTLVGFVRGGGMNVYTHPERVRVAR
ncbi:formate dehydrogenase accessory sulfurtransferase FdhD [Jiangella asiatica]|uniref:Sulfur carrier protein FdhD n=2 Tax=Jiangella asiatica TaxID=2530372 RepID=A0A4R5D7T8_9ACTN|nr:formate dehydrogenase accessory sulfurtransferase FdhD [Jiangella asiatica]TDE08747.1 formate dehydrogenase accessory sulfurtransferase FdhD [Jiangella asiatica]